MTEGYPPDQQWRPARHLVYLARVIREEILRGGGRLIVTMPPRHGKSLLLSLWLPVWFLELWPTKRILLGSYAAGFASEWGRGARNVIERNEGGQLTVRVAQDSSAADRWHTTEGGGMKTSGVGGDFTGHGGDLIIVDDAAAKNRQQADSAARREEVWGWWCSACRTRFEPGATVVQIQTRWHEDDLAGRLLAMDDDRSRWKLINFPAISEDHDVLGRIPGEPLWAERYDLNALHEVERAVGSREWTAMYQQRPSPASGDLFRRETFRYFRDGGGEWVLIDADGGERRVPKGACQVAQTCDTAISEKAGSDWTAVVTFAMTPKREILVLDVVRERCSVPDQLPLLKRCAARWRPTWQGVEDKGGGMAVLQFARREGYPIRPLTPGQRDKRARAFDAIAMYENGQVYHRQDAPWLATFEGELLTFDHGAHDDQVDALAYAAASMRRPEPQIIGL